MTFPFVVWKLILYPGSKHFPSREKESVFTAFARGVILYRSLDAL